jgi:DNA invertase Pin-like site-specific DNA recombinase
MDHQRKSHEDFGAARRLIGYARVSTDDQDLAMQFDALRRIGVMDVNLYSDTKSGSTLKRPGLEAALLDCRPGDCLVVWKLDRLSRSVEDLIALSKRLQDERVQLRSLHEQIDTTSPMGAFFFHLMAALAQFERSLIGFRTKKGMEAAKERGVKLGAPPRVTEIKYKRAMRLLARGVSAEEAGRRVGITGSRLRQKVMQDYGKAMWKTRRKRKTEI